MRIYPALRKRRVDLVAVGRRAAAGASTALSVLVRALRGDAVALGIEDDETAGTFARAGSLEAGVAEKEMQHAALAGVHGLEAEGFAGVLDLVDGGVGGSAEGAGAGCLEAVGVEGDAIVVFGLQAQHLGGDMFEGAEELAIAAQQDFGVGALALDVDVAALKAVGIYGSGSGGDAIFEAESPGGGQQSHQGGDFLSSLC
jgi:hypothetical protein